MKERVKKGICLLLIVLWAFAFAQAPQYMDLYFHHLTGHVEELKYQVHKLEDLFGQKGNDLVNALDRLDHDKQKDFFKSLVFRYQDMETAWEALSDATPWGRPFTFLRQFSLEIGSETTKYFTFGLPITWDGLAYAIIGALLGWGFFHLLRSLFHELKRLVFRNKDNNL